jgi:hypothetical protein
MGFGIMTTKPRHIYEATGISIEPDGDRQTAILLIETAGPIDLALERGVGALHRFSFAEGRGRYRRAGHRDQCLFRQAKCGCSRPILMERAKPLTSPTAPTGIAMLERPAKPTREQALRPRPAGKRAPALMRAPLATMPASRGRFGLMWPIGVAFDERLSPSF